MENSGAVVPSDRTPLRVNIALAGRPRSAKPLAGEPVPSITLWDGARDVDQRHRILPDVKRVDHGVGGGVDHVDRVRVLQSDVDARVVWAGPDAMRPVAMVLDGRDEDRMCAAAPEDERLIEPAHGDVGVVLPI